MLEIVEDFDGSTYRAVYTVTFAAAIYVLHCFQKKSKTGVATPNSPLKKGTGPFRPFVFQGIPEGPQRSCPLFQRAAKHEIERIKKRFKRAEEDHRARQKNGKDQHEDRQ